MTDPNLLFISSRQPEFEVEGLRRNSENLWHLQKFAPRIKIATFLGSDICHSTNNGETHILQERWA